MAQIEADYKQECLKLLDLLARVIDANKDSSMGDDDRYGYAEGLANKYFKHTIIALVVSRGINISDFPSGTIRVIDAGSVDVLTRAAIEAFLIFHYVLYAPQTKEAKDYRYWAYKAAGFAERQSLPVITSKHNQKIAEDKKELDNIRDNLESNATFQSLTQRQKAQMFSGKGEWKWKPSGEGKVSWHDIATDAGLSEVLALHVYSLLSGTAHSSSLSIRQLTQAFRKREEEYLISVSIITINIVTANLIHEYCELFPKSQDVLSKDHEGSGIVEVWVQIGRGLDEFMSAGQDNNKPTRFTIYSHPGFYLSAGRFCGWQWGQK